MNKYCGKSAIRHNFTLGNPSNHLFKPHRTPKLFTSRLVLQLSLPNPLTPYVESKMQLEQAMLQLHASDQQFYLPSAVRLILVVWRYIGKCCVSCAVYWIQRLDSNNVFFVSTGTFLLFKIHCIHNWFNILPGEDISVTALTWINDYRSIYLKLIYAKFIWTNIDMSINQPHSSYGQYLQVVWSDWGHGDCTHTYDWYPLAVK